MAKTAEYSQINNNEWHNYYSKWGAARGKAIKVKTKDFLGMRGWAGSIEKKVVAGETWLGEVWSCEDEEGNHIKAIFRVPYYALADRTENIYVSYSTTIVEGTNYHTDGIEAYMSGNYKLIDRRLLRGHNERFRNRLQVLRDWFNLINNINEPELRLGIQLYLRRLETPNIQTSKEWMTFRPSAQGNQIIHHLQERGVM